MKKRILIPLLCLCVALLFAGGLALLIHSGLSLADALAVFLEKPFAMDTAEAKELIRLGSQPAGPHLYIRHNRRFDFLFLLFLFCHSLPHKRRQNK